MAPVILDKIRESLEDRLGYSELRGTLAETTEELALLRNEAEELGYRTLDYFAGSPQELRKETRHRLAQRSRVAFMEDPLAGAEAEHTANFSLGRGVGRPRAKDDAVQAIIDEAWDDAGNQEVLTSYEALRAISNELKAGANVFPVAYVKNGKVRIGFLNADLVQNIIPDDDNRLRPLWYMVKESKSGWDFSADRVLIPDIGSVRTVKYYPHWRNVEVIDAERKENGEEALAKPPADKLGKGLVYHVRINRLMEQRFGTPPWNRTLRYFSAMARLTEARVNMALAASSFIAKRIVRGGPSEVIKQAQTLIQQTGEIGAAIPKTRERLTGEQPPPRPGSFLTENDGHSLQALTLNSGSSAAVVDAQIVRAAATAPSGFGQHYFGDSSNANLASAVTLELPAMMMVGAWQETLEQMLRWFIELVIQEAVRAGRLGGAVKDPEAEGDDKSLSELRLSEAEDKATAEKRTGKDLSYSFQMPYPGRRDLAAVVAAFTEVMTQLSPIGENEELSKVMLEFLFTHGLQLEDAAGMAESVEAAQQKLIKSQAEQAATQAQAQNAMMAAQTAQQAQMQAAQTQGQQAQGQQRTDINQSQYGENRRTAQPGGDGTLQAELTEDSWLPDGSDAEIEALMGRIGVIMQSGVTEPAVLAAASLNGSH